MSEHNHDADNMRRRFLTAGLSILGSIGGAIASWPFIKAMSPSSRAKAAGVPVEVDLSKIGPGKMVREKWRGKPVWIVRRTPDMLAKLERTEKALRDPESDNSVQPNYTKNRYRSIKPEYLVLVGICTHLGCSPSYRPDSGNGDTEEDTNWQGGFFCACHGSRFDFSGRVYRSVPAPKNLEVPPYYFVNDDKLIIGKSSAKETV